MERHQTFSGTCVGGPRDGEHLIHRSPVYRVPIMQKNAMTIRKVAKTNPSAETTYKTGSYQYVETIRIWEWSND